MGYSMTHTETIIVHGKTMDIYPDKPSKIRDKEITVRITVDDDESRKILSLADELRGILLEVPLEPIENMLRWAIKNA